MSLNRFFTMLRSAKGGVLAVGISTLLVAISSTAAFSITPFFLHEVLGINVKMIGMIEAVTESLSQFSRLFSGFICDKMRRCKPMYVIGTFFSFLAKPLLFFASGAGLVVASKISDRLGNGLSATPRDQYVALNSKEDDKGANIGLTMTFKTIGCVMGPFIVMGATWFYGDSSEHIKSLLFFTTLPAFLAVYVAAIHIKEKTTYITSKSRFSIKFFLNLNSRFWFILGIMFFFMLARAPECYLLLNLKNSGVPQWFCSGAIGFFNLVSVFISYPAGLLSDKLGREKMLLVSFSTLCISTFCFFTGIAFLGVVGVLFWGIQRASSQIISVACISDMVDKKILGSAIGLLNLVSGIAVMIASYISGVISEHYSICMAYGVSTVFGIVSCVLLYIFIAAKKLDDKKSC